MSEIRFSEEETQWTENIKRSVLNLLQINVNKASEETDKQFYNVHEVQTYYCFLTRIPL